MPKVLVLDDDSDYAAHLQATLKLYGHNAEAAGTSREALEVARRFRPQVLVVGSDLGEGENGIDVAESLQQVNPNLPIVLVTGHVTPRLLSKAEDRGIFAVYEKSTELLELLHMVARAAAAHNGY